MSMESACSFLSPGSSPRVLGCWGVSGAAVHLCICCVCGEPLSAVTIRPGMMVHFEGCGPRKRFGSCTLAAGSLAPEFWFCSPVSLSFFFSSLFILPFATFTHCVAFRLHTSPIR